MHAEPFAGSEGGRTFALFPGEGNVWPIDVISDTCREEQRRSPRPRLVFSFIYPVRNRCRGRHALVVCPDRTRAVGLTLVLAMSSPTYLAMDTCGDIVQLLVYRRQLNGRLLPMGETLWGFVAAADQELERSGFTRYQNHIASRCAPHYEDLTRKVSRESLVSSGLSFDDIRISQYIKIYNVLAQAYAEAKAYEEDRERQEDKGVVAAKQNHEGAARAPQTRSQRAPRSPARAQPVSER